LQGLLGVTNSAYLKRFLFSACPVLHVQLPEELEAIHERLISAYEEVLPAYDNVIEAAESGEPGKLNSAVRESLPRIERFNDEVSSITQDLEQATGAQ